MPDFALPPPLEPFRERLAATLRPVARFALSDEAPEGSRGSFAGGVPCWPGATPWPTGPDGAPLHFLVQIDLADVPRLPSGAGVLPGLPATGLLQVFLADTTVYGCALSAHEDPAAQDAWRLVYHPAADLPDAGLSPAGPARDRGKPEYFPLTCPAQARRLVFDPAVAYEPVNGSNAAFEVLLGADAFDLAEERAAETGEDAGALEELFFTLGLPSMSRHKIGGWPDYVQHDPGAETPGARHLLLQLDSDVPAAHGFLWGDVGTAQWLVSPADLAAGRLDRVLYDWACG